jgi:hypothetical protein
VTEKSNSVAHIERWVTAQLRWKKMQEVSREKVRKVGEVGEVRKWTIEHWEH